MKEKLENMIGQHCHLHGGQGELLFQGLLCKATESLYCLRQGSALRSTTFTEKDVRYTTTENGPLTGRVFNRIILTY